MILLLTVTDSLYGVVKALFFVLVESLRGLIRWWRKKLLLSVRLI